MADFHLLLPEIPKPKGPFSPSASYSRVGDLLKVYLDEEESYAHPLTPEITVLIGFKSGRITGVKVANIASKIAEVK